MTYCFLFIALNPLSMVLRQVSVLWNGKGEVQGQSPPLDDARLFAKNEKETESLVQTVRIVSDDIDMKFGLDKCAVWSLLENDVR